MILEALESMSNTLTAFFGLKEGSIMDDKSDEQGLPDDGEQQSGGSCSSDGVQFDDVDDSLEKLDAPDEMDEIEAPEEEMEQVQDSNEDVRDVLPELNEGKGSSNEPKLASVSPEKPKLAERSNNTRRLPKHSKRENTHRGGGKIFHGVSSGGNSGAISG